jgi:acyl dehydratase
VGEGAVIGLGIPEFFERRHVVANLGWDKVKATHPVFAGDTLYAESTVLSKRESKRQRAVFGWRQVQRVTVAEDDYSQ